MDRRGPEGVLEALASGRSPLFLMHVGADPDCVGSAYALQEAFGGVVGAPDGLNRPGDRLARDLGLRVDTFPHPENHDPVVAVDLGTASSLGPLAGRVGPLLLVDHHRYGDLHDAAPAKAWDPGRGSCCEVVLDLLDLAGRTPSPAAARGLLTGLVADTGRFRFADARSLAAAARMVEMGGGPVQRVYDLLAGEDEAAEDLEARRVALLAATRAQVEDMGGFLVAASHAGSFDAVAAGALVRAGADVAIVGRERGKEARMSLRASPRVLSRGVHLGRLVHEVGGQVGWSAGGHEGAAGMRGSPPLAPARDALLQAIRARLEGP